LQFLCLCLFCLLTHLNCRCRICEVTKYQRTHNMTSLRHMYELPLDQNFISFILHAHVHACMHARAHTHTHTCMCVCVSCMHSC
jgi:hypothetical protein